MPSLDEGAMIRLRAHAIYVGALFVTMVAAMPGIAHDHATGIVKERMDRMASMAKSMKNIRERIKAKRDLTAIKADAEAIQTLAAHIVHMFPTGSAQSPTQAKAAIWQNWSDFEVKAQTTEVESSKLAATSPENFDAIAAQARALSQSCSDCHEKYRVKK